MRDGLRGDIEGLRAIAVLAVLAYHAKLGPFHGGYVGVDVFFVVSGFLITSLLARDLLSNGSAALPTFWARRARRLLPASFLVVASTLLIGRSVLDPLARRDAIRDGAAAATFTVNVVFANRQNDYLAAQLAPSPLLHYWSLALEEQFYIVWPLVLLVATRFRRNARQVMLAVICVLLTVSLAMCILLTAHHQPAAFFLLPTRAWELLAGAALAMSGPAIARIPIGLRAAIGWLGLIVIAATTLSFDDTTRFPGTAAIVPVAATVAVLAAGTDAATRGPALLLNRGPLTWLGARSYGTYLWHWPVLVLAATAYGPLDAVQRAAAIAIAIGMASLSFQLLENPVRRSAWLSVSARRGLTLGGALVVSGVGFAGVLLAASPAVLGSGIASPPALLLPSSSAGPATTVPTSFPATSATAVASPASTPTPTPTAVPSTAALSTTGAVPPAADTVSASVLATMVAANAEVLHQGAVMNVVPANLTPSVGRARSDKPLIYSDGCILNNGQTSIKDCYFGDTTSTVTIALFGDSHAAQWFPALDEIAASHHWRLDVVTKKGCPTADIPISDAARGPECGPWRAKAMAHLATEHPTLIIMSAYRYSTTSNAVGSTPDEVWSHGLQITLDTIRPLSDKLLVLGDTPTPLNDVPGCLAGHMRTITSCLNSRSEAIKPGRLAVEADLAKTHDASFVPTGDWLCTIDVCPVVIGNLLVYRDNSHITTAASKWLEPYMLAAVGPLVSR
jgi:peptidoglycan/LPS O-acetylase OafA/YrhL